MKLNKFYITHVQLRKMVTTLHTKKIQLNEGSFENSYLNKTDNRYKKIIKIKLYIYS
jgi:hypothetical protein